MRNIKIYNLRIVPSAPVFNEVVQFKKLFINRFGKHPLSKSKPHITVAVFEMDTEYQDILVKAFSQLSNNKKFKLAIQGFGVFENNAHVLLLKIPTTEAIKNLHTDIKVVWQRDLHRKLGTLKLSAPPHITISKTDGKKTLYESLAFFQKSGFTSKEIEVNQLTLVSRPKGKTWDWEHHIPLT